MNCLKKSTKILYTTWTRQTLMPPYPYLRDILSWWRHQMETFSVLLAICAGNSPVAGEFSAQRPVTRSFDVYFDLRLNKRLSKQSWGWWFETPSRPLCRHCNVCERCVWFLPAVVSGMNNPHNIKNTIRCTYRQFNNKWEHLVQYRFNAYKECALL